jgi:DNA segregation ATPase FtsK/SpoIIIE, S-DNA-T family
MRLYVWMLVRRAAVMGLLVVLTVMFLAASASPRGTLASVVVLLASAYVVGTLVAARLMTGWIWRHRAVVIVTGMVAGHFPAGESWPAGKRQYMGPRLWDYRTEGRVQHYRFLMPVGMTLTLLNTWREALEQALDRAVDWGYEGKLYHLRVISGRMPDRVSFAEVYGRAPAGELVFCAGMTLLGPVWADLAALPHLLVGGVPGGGKSVFLRQLVAHLTLSNPPERLRLGLIDLKGGMELNVFGRLPHRLWPVRREWQECTVLLEYLNGELDRRQAAFDQAEVVSLAEWNGRYPGSILPYLVLVIDETAELTAVESPDRQERASRQAQLAFLVRICRLGRAVGIHVVCATQRPDSDAVPGQLKANLPATMAFRVRDPVNSRVLLGDGHPEAASLPPIPGRGIWQVDGQVEVQTPWLSREETSALLAETYQPGTSGGTGRVTQCPLPPGSGARRPVRPRHGRRWSRRLAAVRRTVRARWR